MNIDNKLEKEIKKEVEKKNKLEKKTSNNSSSDILGTVLLMFMILIMGFVIYYNYDNIKNLINSFKNEPSYTKTVYTNNDNISETVKTMSHIPTVIKSSTPPEVKTLASVTAPTSSSDTDLFILLAASNHK